MYVIGTAGHVDHGKSTLVKALTGINPDRLEEEQQRQMTIDLGFAWLTLPSGLDVSVVDVPGHEDFVKNMLAGIGGIDAALFVVAADEAVMPQTREHLAIIDLLGIERGVVALTKVDLVKDEEWLSLVVDEIETLLMGTSLEGSHIIPCSATSGQGLDELLAELDRLLADAPERPDLGLPRLPVDRVFTMSGFGTVVTGTLSDGWFEVGQDVEIRPGEGRARIRGLQSHRETLEKAGPGSRLAINLAGIDKDAVQRGQVIAAPGVISGTLLLDVSLRVVNDAPTGIDHDDELEFYTGSSRVLARVRLLDAEDLLPGESGWGQLRLSEALACKRGDRFVLRRPSPADTLGGGVVLNTRPGRRYKRNDLRVIERLKAFSGGSPLEIMAALPGNRPQSWQELRNASGLAATEALTALGQLVQRGSLVLASGSLDALRDDSIVFGREAWETTCQQALELLEDFYVEHPLRVGMSREELRSRLRLSDEAFDAWSREAQARGTLQLIGGIASLAEHKVVLTVTQQQAVDGVYERIRNAGYTPPALGEVEAEIGSELLGYLIESGRLVRVSPDLAYEAGVFTEMQERVVAFLKEHGQATVAEIRDLLGTSRRYTLALLEALDQRRVTRRLGDTRVLRGG